MVEISPFRVAMRGTEAEPRRCVALTGTIGQDGHCGIHPVRPSVCREFEASWSEGRHEPRCDAARLRYGMTPLTPEDWLPERPVRARPPAA